MEEPRNDLDKFKDDLTKEVINNEPKQQQKMTAAPGRPIDKLFRTYEVCPTLHEIQHIQENARIENVTKETKSVNSVWSQQCEPEIGDLVKETKDHGCAFFDAQKVGQANSQKIVAVGKGEHAGHIELDINMDQQWEILDIEKIRAHGGIYYSAKTKIPEWPDEVHINLMYIEDTISPKKWHRWTKLTKTTEENMAKRVMSHACLNSTSSITVTNTTQPIRPTPKRKPNLTRAMMATKYEHESGNRTHDHHDSAHSYLAKFSKRMVRIQISGSRGRDEEK